MFDAKAFIAVLMLTARFLTPAQTTPPVRELSIEQVHNRIAVLDKRFEEIRDSVQKQLDAANCRAGCPELGKRLSSEMLTAMNAVANEIHNEVDSFIRLIAGSSRTTGLDPELVRNRLQQVLPKTAEVPSVLAGSVSDTGYLIIAYCLHKGVMGPGGTSVTIRAYNKTAAGVRLADVTGDNMDGFDRLTAKEVHPLVIDPAAPLDRETYLLLSGYMTGANGPLNRMRLYAYNGKKFRSLWMPEDIWGQFDVQVIDGGFRVEGDYYQENRKRKDAYHLLMDGVLRAPQPIR
jgi:hypothetical protein